MIWAVITAALGTSFISGILGMGGGMILMGVFCLLLPVAPAMLLHGITQASSNGFRAFLHRQNIKWKVLPVYFAGALVSFLLFVSINFIPSKSLVLLILGLSPFIALALPKSIDMDILKKRNSFLSGIVVTAAQILAGASGPVLDIFYINSRMNRFEIIATKAMTQTLGHLIKLVYYGLFLYINQDASSLQLALIPAVILSACTGTRFGKSVLEKLSEKQFQKYSRVAIILIGIFYIFKGVNISL